MTGDVLTGVLAETLAVFDSVSRGTPLTTSEVAAELDVGRRSTYERLDRLVGAGRLETKAVGARGRVWWVPLAEHAPRDGVADSNHRVDGPAGVQGASTAGPGARSDGRQPAVEPYQRILETMEDGVYVVDSAGYISLVNDAYCEMTGYSRAELVGMRVDRLVDEATVEAARAYEAELVDGAREFARFEADVLTADGSTFRGEGVFSLLERADGGVERVGVVRDVTDRNRRERALEQRREWLASLNDLNHAIRDVSHAVIEQSTRSEIEQVVCQALVDTDSYGVAWIGDIDGATKIVRPRAVAGADVALDDVAVSIDVDDAAYCASTARAVLDGEIQVRARPPTELARLAGWEALASLDLQASAAIPIGYDSRVSGVLCVYTNREHGFRTQEAELFGFLGEVVGHAITSVERNRALMTDAVIELEFRVEDAFEQFGVVAVPGRLTLESLIPLENHQFLAYGTASAALREPLVDVVDAIPYVASLTVLEDCGSEIRFEARLADPPVFVAVSTQGGYLDMARLEDGDYYLRIHIAAGTDARQIVDVVQETYPDAALVSQRQVTRSQDSPIRLSRVVADELTDRQRVVLETAFAAGYFESTRLRSGSDIAAALGISASTFHEHLRKALHTFLAGVLVDHGGAEPGALPRVAQLGEQSR